MRLIDADELLYDDLECTNGNTYMIVHAPEIEFADTVTYKQMFEGMTNGEVIENIYANCHTEHIGAYVILVSNRDKFDVVARFDDEWWNAPYKGGEQE